MVTLGDAEWSVYQGLRSLPRRPYLVTMWILCGELQTLYAPWTGNDAAALMIPTMELVREAAVSGESAELSRRGLDLARAWRPVYADTPGRTGWRRRPRSGGGTTASRARSW
jgi:hypothetical protein